MIKTILDVTDLFSGGGGSSTGAKAAGQGRGLILRYALNHNATAIMVHNNNHPEADHFLGNVRQTNPRAHPRTRLLISCPSCTDFSQAKTHKHHIDLRQYPMFADDAKKYEAAIAERQSRVTMWDVVRFTEAHRYDAIICENVWQVKKWEDYDTWWAEMEKLGYEGKTVYLNSMFFHSLNEVKHSRFAPQSRDRWYTVWRKQGVREVDLDFQPLGPCPACQTDVRCIQGWRNTRRQYGVWNRNYDYYCPACATKITPYFYPAIHCIDFSIPIKRIGDPTRRNTISLNTKRRIKAGLEKYGLHPVNLDKARGDKARSALLYPLFTQTGTTTQTMSFPPQMIDLSRPRFAHNDNGQIRNAAAEPAFTQTTSDTFGFVISTKYDGHLVRLLPERESLTTNPSQGVVFSGQIVELYGNGATRSLTKDELNTVTAGGGKSGLAFISTYNGNAVYSQVVQDSLPSVTSVDRCGLTEAELDSVVEDCYYRTLRPDPELIAAMGMPEDYDFTDVKKGKRLPGWRITRLLGQAVTPSVMEWLVSRVLDALDER
jgi:DNA (cytosine-5)-methyltransferase 1